MKSAILQMFYGKRGLMEQVPLSEKQTRVTDCAMDKVMAFRERLSEELQKEFDEVYDKIADMHVEDVEVYYAEGFRFGALIGMDIMNGENK